MDAWRPEGKLAAVVGGRQTEEPPKCGPKWRPRGEMPLAYMMRIMRDPTTEPSHQ
jgi:hypothetical protein